MTDESESLKKLVYPVIVSEFNDDGHYFVATSPNIPGMVTQGDSLADVQLHARDAIETMLEDEHRYPEVVDTKDWTLKDNEQIVYVTVDFDQK